VPDFEYFAFHHQVGITDPLEGILGLCMGNQMILAEEEIEVGPLFVDSLVTAGKIDEAEFSFAMYGLDID
jgi:hypothetical protein